MIEFKGENSNYFYSTLSANEFMPKTVKDYGKLPPRGNNSMMLFKPDVLYEPIGPPSKYLIHFKAKTDKSSEAAILQYYFPGWKVILNDQEISKNDIVTNLGPYGLIRVMLEPGENEIRAYYDGPPGWHLRNYLIVAVLLLSVMFFILIEYFRKRNFEVR